MSIFEVLILGLMQGAAEFLPISSSGHLVLLPWWFGWETPSLLYTIVVHMGTTLAIIGYFWRDWLALIRAGLTSLRKRRMETPDERLFWLIVLASIPAGLVGLLVQDVFEDWFLHPISAACFLFVTAGLLTLSEYLSRPQPDGAAKKDLTMLSPRDALFIGVAQAFAILPGVSRSGSTIAAGLIRNLDRAAAARFSFLMATPITVAAGLLEALDVLRGDIATDEKAAPLLVGFFASLVAGYACIAFLLRFIRQQKLYVFAIYCVLAGGASLLLALIRA